MSQRAWTRSGRSSFVSEDRCSLFLGNWGIGHAVPPKEMLTELISLLTSNLDMKDIVAMLNAGNVPGCVQSHAVTSFFANENYDLSIDAHLRNEAIHVSAAIECDGDAPQDIKYACYLYKNGHRIEVAPYQNTSEWVFEGDFVGARTEVIAFAQDVFGNRLSASITLNT